MQSACCLHTLQKRELVTEKTKMTFFLLFLYLALLSSQLDRAGSFRFLRSTAKRQLSDIPRLQLRLDANKPSTAATIVASSFIFLTGSSISIAAGLEDFDSTPAKATNQYDYAQEMNDAAQVHFTLLYLTSLHSSLHFTSLHFTSLHFTSLHFTTT